MPKNIVRVRVLDLRDPEPAGQPRQFDGSALVCGIMKYLNGQGTSTVVVTFGEEMEVGVMLADIIRYLEDAHPGFVDRLMKTVDYNTRMQGEFTRAG